MQGQVKRTPLDNRFPSPEDYRDCQRLIEWYGAKSPRLRKQWEDRMRMYEAANAISVDM